MAIRKKRSGDDGEEDPPVPIPNTEVKLFSADGTWRETARESRTLPEQKMKPSLVNGGFNLIMCISVKGKSVNFNLIFPNSSVGRAHDC